MSEKTILVTGGAGYIGSHTCVLLLEAGYDVVVVDNLCNSKSDSLSRVEVMTGRAIQFHLADLRDADAVKNLFDQEKIDAVIHFAGLKAVGESTQIPLDYYQNNVGGTANLLEEMNRHGVKDIVFSSSCTVYGAPESLPLREDSPLQAMSPYGQTKLTIEYMLMDLAAADPEWDISILRYFNPAGAHPSGRIGEHPSGVPNNLMPYIAQVAVGRRQALSVFGGDYPTPDGTGVRDYIHVMDLAEGHVAALRYLQRERGLLSVNLGTGRGASVLEMLAAFESACGKTLPYEVVARRAGDVAACYADPSLADECLQWRANRSVEAMCEDAWRWQSGNPSGYR